MLDRLATASQLALEMHTRGDALLGYFVQRCRSNGLTWAEISAALGVSRQAAHKRFAEALSMQAEAPPESPQARSRDERS